jgi:hypothetical protein
MTKPSDFILNTDYTTLKQVLPHLTGSFTIPAGTYPEGQTWTVPIVAPSGSYVENVALGCSLYGGQKYPTNMASFVIDGMGNNIIAGVFQNSPTVYYLKLTLGPSQGQSVTIGSPITFDASINLSLSPFVKQN